MPRASDLATGPLRKKLRGDLDAILATALHPDPDRRYQTAAALRDELLRYLNREPVIARRGARFVWVAQVHCTSSLAVAASVLGLVGLCATLAFALTQARLASAERDRAFVLATRNSAVTEFLGVLMTEAAESDGPVTVNDMLARSEKLALADISGDPDSRAAVQLRLGGPISSEREADVLQSLAASYHMTGRHREAFEHYEMALKKFTARARRQRRRDGHSKQHGPGERGCQPAEASP